MSNRPRVEKLSLDFMKKAKQALAAGDEKMAKECLKMRDEQLSAASDMISLVSSEEEKLDSINNELGQFGRSIHYLQPSSQSRKLLPLPKIVPKTAAMPYLNYTPLTGARIVDQWSSAFAKESRDFDSFALYAETKLNEAIHTSNEENGGDIRLIEPGLPAVCCDLLVKMGSASFGFRFAPLLRLLTTQILRCIYEDTNTVAVEDLDANRVSLRYLFGRKPWFLRLREVTEQRDDLQQIVSFEAQGKSMKDVLDKKNQGIKLMFKRETALARQLAFRAWRNYFILERGRRRKFKRYQLNMWMRRWKTAHFSDPATAAAATTSSGAASDPSERAWQKRFRASEKEKLGLQEEIDELRRRLENSTHELAVTYEIIQDLQPDHDHTGAGEQSAAARHQSDDLLKKAQEEAQAANRRRFGSLIDVKKGLHNWKDKVLDRLKKKQSTKSLHDLTVFKRQDVITNNMETQTDLVGPVKADDSKEHLDPKKKTKTKPKRLGEVAGKESAKIPKMSIKQAVQIIADVLSKACTQHETNQRTGREGVSFPEFVRDCLIRQFGIKSLALKTLKSLCATSRSGHESDNMLALFNELAAIEGPGPSKRHLDRDDDAVVDFCVDLAIKFLIEICPDKNFKQISVTLSSETDRSWGRPLVLDGLFSCFSFFRLKSPEGYKELTTEVMQLPVTILRGKDKEPRIPLDQSLLILVKYALRELECKTAKPSPLVTTIAEGRMKNLVGKFAFSTCSLRMQQMMASRKLFREWDKKLHQPHEPEEKEDEEEIDPAAGVYGAFSFDEFTEMVCLGLGIDLDEADVMLMFNEWHELIEFEKKQLGYEEGDLVDTAAKAEQQERRLSVPELKKEVTEVELEMEAESKKLEAEASMEAATSRRRSSVTMLQSKEANASDLSRPGKPLPKMSKAKAKWKMAVRTLNINFFFSKPTKQDEKLARELEAGLGGSKFGESAFSQILWKYRLFVKK
ncbi:hypothetical protein TeGR_g4956 [Tetraparma gracilis]|uniref:Uncharacterized protein n=1 Tax=Tetraparma gracilis TaxID=2962635 RepID=A0ABQ6MHQ9_9STRA|nr:hypothetical protein TeGR_g4956 [Tetraparma gracilis]